jgi:hypothetical protein
MFWASKFTKIEGMGFKFIAEGIFREDPKEI